MYYDELEFVLRLFAQYELYDSLDIVRPFYELDSGGFVVAVHQPETGEERIVGACAAPMTTHKTAFLGVYVVDERFQGLGIGKRLFAKCVDPNGSARVNCGLCAVPEKFRIYRDKAHFTVEEGVSIVVYEGKPRHLKKWMQNVSEDNEIHLERLVYDDPNEGLIRKIIDFDTTVHLDIRDRLLRKTFCKDGVITTAAIDSNTGEVIGYGCCSSNIGRLSMIEMRNLLTHLPFAVGQTMFGPLYANSDAIAAQLLRDLMDCEISEMSIQMGAEAFMVTTDNRPQVMSLVGGQIGLPEVTRCAKLYTRFVPPFNYSKLYLCHTPDFGC